jgi:hypothetical protein
MQRLMMDMRLHGHSTGQVDAVSTSLCVHRWTWQGMRTQVHTVPTGFNQPLDLSLSQAEFELRALYVQSKRCTT